MAYSDRLHPLTVFLWYCAILTVTMTATHPASLLGFLLFAVFLRGLQIGIRRLLAGIPGALLFLLSVSLINLLFVHRGSRILFFLNGRPITLEAGFAGLISGVMILSVILFCACLSHSLPGETMIALFGVRLPRLALLLRMTVGFLPRFRRRFREISDARATLRPEKERGFLSSARSLMTDLSVLLSLSLEESMDAADGMKARGYGLPGATRAIRREKGVADLVLLPLLLFLTLAALVPLFTGRGEWGWYPLDTSLLIPADWALVAFLSGTALAAIPVILEGKETLKWRILRSRI